MPNFSIVDAHVHLYDVDRLRYPWLESVPDLRKPFLIDDYSDAVLAVPIEQFVFVEVAAQIGDSVAEARWINDHCATDAGRLGPSRSRPALGAIVAQARVECGAAVEEDLNDLLEIKSVTGIRRIVSAPFQSDVDFCLRPLFIEGVNRIGRYNLSFDIGASASDLPRIIAFARQCPDVQLILGHLGMPLIESGMMHPWQEHIRELAKMPHVSCKLSGLLTAAGTNPSTEAMAPYVLEAVNAFGFERVIFGSDYPMQNAAGGCSVWLETLSAILADASHEELRLLFCENARRVYRIPS